MQKLFIILLMAAAALPQSRVSQQGVHRMEVTLERFEDGAWKPIDPGLVVAQNDRVRFRFKANFSGFLYVTNRSTSNNTTLLFPRQDTGSNNRVVSNREYVVPATKGAFRVDGPPGYDVVAWTVSPVELGRPEAPQPPEAPPSDLKPRCDDTIWKARGTCVDSAAGPQAKSRGASDGLIFMRHNESSVISSPVPLKAPIVYEFHLAHK